ncbi:hypothetical protein LTR65_005821 [Meristemomyces frigidus]
MSYVFPYLEEESRPTERFLSPPNLIAPGVQQYLAAGHSALLITDLIMLRNTSPNQKRNLKPSVSTASAYSASPSQLTLSSDVSTVGGFHNPYQSYNTYAPSPHNPTGFAFPQQHSQYTHQLQTQHQSLPQQHQQSPAHTRKRRASELGSEGLPGSTSSNASNAFGNPPGLVTGSMVGDLGLSGGLGGPSHQGEQLTSPVAKKGRTNTPWTPAEEQRLKTLRDAGSSWSEIAKTFPARTEGSVKKHWYKVRFAFHCARLP